MNSQPQLREVTPGLLARVAAVDVVAVIVFAVIGRATHGEGIGPVGVAGTAWPFLAGLVVGWVLSRLWQRPLALPAGMVIWAATVGGGMLLRAYSGQGTAPAFLVVAAIVLGVLLIGWRAVAAAVIRRRTV